ncbi:hypothetical protein OH76DRAFT_1402259 [Lentinus brumalis]|uniref:FHA domain-containing protein n=1 Tax=Lentinus brumalis TaxID=2498619 RepID=A0A371DDQ8_9APHY|nr:hypothetical protein OH76DRAFT_1402259 [Polyporus brumalis]
MEGTDNERSHISGIVLHVEESDGQPSEVLTFRKTESRTIFVGRKPFQAGSQSDPSRALFRCPVVSRKHAKITFAEFGNVYISDLHSHHGTHILRPGDFVSTALLPEVSTVLADGDRITFGKSVGRDTYTVKPVVVRIELMFGGDVPTRAPSPPPISLCADTVDEAHHQPHGRNSELDTTATSGRYGIFIPSPRSSSSSSDGESDIQEISPPTSPRESLHPPFIFPRDGGSNSSLGGGRLQFLRHFLPPIHRLSPELSPEPSYFAFSKEPSVGENRVVGGAVGEEDMELSSSRESSPMEARSDVHDQEDIAIIGSWPTSPWRVSEPPSMIMQREVIEISDDDGSPSSDPSVLAHETFAGNQLRDEPEVEMTDSTSGQGEAVASVEEHMRSQFVDDRVEITEPGDAIVTVDLSIIEAQVADTYTELNVLRAAHDQSEADFGAHIQQTKEKLDVLDAEMHSTQVALIERAGELLSVQTRLQEIGEVMKLLQEHAALSERVEELVQEVTAAKKMLQETCELHHAGRTQLAEELEAVKALRVEASVAVAEAKAACVSAQDQAGEVVNFLKRKREAMEAEDPVPPLVDASKDLVVPAPKRRRAMRVVSAVARTATVATFGAVAAWGALAFS